MQSRDAFVSRPCSLAESREVISRAISIELDILHVCLSGCNFVVRWRPITSMAEAVKDEIEALCSICGDDLVVITPATESSHGRYQV